MQTAFEKISFMNELFSVPRGVAGKIDWDKALFQAHQIYGELTELNDAIEDKDITEIRDASADIKVFAYGLYHILGMDADEALQDFAAQFIVSPNSGLIFDKLFSGSVKTKIRKTKKTVEWGVAEKFVNKLGDIIISIIDNVSEKVSSEILFDLNRVICTAYELDNYLGVHGDYDLDKVFNSNMSKFCRDEEEVELTVDKYEILGVSTYIEGRFPYMVVKSADDVTGADGKEYRKSKVLKSIKFEEPVFDD